MKNLLIKEFKLSINPFFLILPILVGALILIPQWPYFFALMYFGFITVPNVFSVNNTYGDIQFSALLPIRKRDIVKARFLSIIILEIIHILFAIVFAIINVKLYKTGNFLLDTNYAFFGFGFAMYGVFNLAFFPRFYKTAHKYGLATILGSITFLLFAGGVETLILTVDPLKKVLDGFPSDLTWQFVTLGAGIIIFMITTHIAFKISASRFERVDL